LRKHSEAAPIAVGAYITAAYCFTSSTSFANPAGTFARAAGDAFAGMRPEAVPGFTAVQFLGVAAATALLHYLVPSLPEGAPALVVPHTESRGREEKYQ